MAWGGRAGDLNRPQAPAAPMAEGLAWVLWALALLSLPVTIWLDQLPRPGEQRPLRQVGLQVGWVVQERLPGPSASASIGGAASSR